MVTDRQTKKAQQIKKDHVKTTLKCKLCNRETPTYDNVVSIICHICCAGYGPDTAQKLKEKEVKNPGFPSGWMFYKTFVHQDGRVFEKGVENVALKGTLEPTVVVKKPKLSRFEKEAKLMAKEKKLANKYKKKMKKIKESTNDARE